MSGRVDRVRKFLEDELSFSVFFAAYEFIKNIIEQQKEEIKRKEIVKILGKRNMKFL